MVGRRLVDQCRNQLNLKENTQEHQDGETSGPLASSDGNREMQRMAQKVLARLAPDAAVPLDRLIESLEGSSPSEIIATLFELEMAGLVRQLPGKSFIKVWAD